MTDPAPTSEDSLPLPGVQHGWGDVGRTVAAGRKNEVPQAGMYIVMWT